MLLIPASLVFAAGVAAVAMFFRMSDTSSWVSHTLEVRLAASRLFSQIQDAETGERGYLLTGQDAFLEPYMSAAARIKNSLNRLRSLTLSDTAQQEVLDKLAPLIESKLNIIEEVVALAREGKKDQAAPLAVPGKAVMDRIRALIEEFSETENAHLAVRERIDARARSILLFLIIFGLAGASVLSAAAISSQARLVKNLQDEAARRELAEATLRQAQKMEAIGNLTGGMAHDFNNVLGVIIGNLDLLKRLITDNAAAAELCGEALDGASRCTDLIRRLLAFARRQSLRPEITDMNALVGDIARLLGRTSARTSR